MSKTYDSVVGTNRREAMAIHRALETMTISHLARLSSEERKLFLTIGEQINQNPGNWITKEQVKGLLFIPVANVQNKDDIDYLKKWICRSVEMATA